MELISLASVVSGVPVSGTKLLSITTALPPVLPTDRPQCGVPFSMQGCPKLYPATKSVDTQHMPVVMRYDERKLVLVLTR